MHGITHLYRQHAVEKQMSGGESWSRHIYPGYGSSAEASSQGSRLYSVDSSSSSSSNSNNSGGGGGGGGGASDNLGGVTGSAYAQWQSERHSQPQAVPDANKSLANHHYRNSPTHHSHSHQPQSHLQHPTSGSLKRTPSSKRSFLERSHSPAIYGVSI